jgi:hypothetical protein
MKCKQLTARGTKCKLPVCCGSTFCNIHIPDCSICMNKLSTSGGEGGLIKTKCGHLFHKTCLNRWLGDEISCPLCRNELKLPKLSVTICPSLDDNVTLTMVIIIDFLKRFYGYGLIKTRNVSIVRYMYDKNVIIAVNDDDGSFIGVLLRV